MNYPAAILLLALIVLSVAAIAGARGAKWKMVNFGIIIGFMAAGVGMVRCSSKYLFSCYRLEDS